jgi:hypothetical protein
MAVLDELTAEVTRTKGVAESAVALINGLADKLDVLIANGVTPEAVQALRDDLKASTDTLAAAVAENPVP